MDDANRKLYKSVGSLIASYRRGQYSQAALAAHLKLSRASIANIERGEQTLQLHYLVRIADLLGVSPKALLPDKMADHADATGGDAATLDAIKRVARSTRSKRE